MSNKKVVILKKAIIPVPKYLKVYFDNNPHLEEEYYHHTKVLMHKRANYLIDKSLKTDWSSKMTSKIEILHPRGIDPEGCKIISVYVGNVFANYMRASMKARFDSRFFEYINDRREDLFLRPMIERFIRLHRLEGAIDADALEKRYQHGFKKYFKTTRFRKLEENASNDH